MARYNTIFAGPTTERAPQVQEAPAAANLMPGTIAIATTGSFAAVTAAGSRGAFRVIQESYLGNKGADVAIATGNVAVGIIPQDGQLLRVLVPTGVNVAAGAPLAVNNAGKAVLATGDGTEVLFYADEAYDNTSGADQLVQVRPAYETISA